MRAPKWTPLAALARGRRTRHCLRLGSIRDAHIFHSGCRLLRTAAAGVAVGSYIYLAGGSAGHSELSTVYRAQLLDPLAAPNLMIAPLFVTEPTSFMANSVYEYCVSANFPAHDPTNPGGESLCSGLSALVSSASTFSLFCSCARCLCATCKRCECQRAVLCELVASCRYFVRQSCRSDTVNRRHVLQPVSNCKGQPNDLAPRLAGCHVQPELLGFRLCCPLAARAAPCRLAEQMGPAAAGLHQFRNDACEPCRFVQSLSVGRMYAPGAATPSLTMPNEWFVHVLDGETANGATINSREVLKVRALR